MYIKAKSELSNEHSYIPNFIFLSTYIPLFTILYLFCPTKDLFWQKSLDVLVIGYQYFVKIKALVDYNFFGGV